MERPVLLSAVECNKNPGHPQFVPISAFRPSHLPMKYRSQLIWALIKSKAVLTVLLRVGYVSPHRPLKFQLLNSVSNIGSGHVTSMDETNPEFIILTIETAAHVVFDKVKAEKTTVEFFCTYPTKVFTLRKVELLAVNTRKDICKLICKIDSDALIYLKPMHILRAIEEALSPKIYGSLLRSVLIRNTSLSLPWLCFLYNEISCMKSMTIIAANTRRMEIEVNISRILTLDVILLLIALASSGPFYLFTLFENILVSMNLSKVQHLENMSRPYITLTYWDTNNNENHGNTCYINNMSLDTFLAMDSKHKVNRDFTTVSNKTLNKFITLLNQSPINIDEFNATLTKFCSIGIQVRQDRSSSLVFTLPVPVNAADYVYLSNKKLEIKLNAINVEGEEDTGVYMPVLISHPHGLSMHVTSGETLSNSSTNKFIYDAASCDGSSGGQLLMIPSSPQSFEEIEDIGAITHSSATAKLGFGNRF